LEEEVPGMLILVLGGGASGKSARAEDLACGFPGKRLYVATMEPFGAEAEKRIARHRAMRSEKGFESVDCYRELSSLDPQKDTQVILLECLGNLLANEMFGRDAPGCEDRIRRGLMHLEGLPNIKHLVVVSNEVSLDGDRYDPETLEYIRILNRLNGWLADRADRVEEVVCGIPLLLKGEEGV